MLINKNCFNNSYKKVLYLTTLLLPMIALFSCNENKDDSKPERSFYYWKSALKLTSFELNLLDTLNIKTIYLKFFDVGWDANSRLAVPVAKLHIRDKRVLKKCSIIPTVFITNETIQKIDSSEIEMLAGKIFSLITNICVMNEINHIDEIQIDCDWSESTGKKYFAFLKTIKKLSKKNISATIRLHQIKFLSKTGVPPVDRGLLMCYNMGNLKNPATKNSILEVSELKKYTGNLTTYPLQLDLALPLFDWMVLFRNNIYIGLIENIPVEGFTNSFTLKNKERVEILKDTLLSGYDLKNGDVLRIEESRMDDIMAAEEEVKKHLKNTLGRVCLYHLDSVTLKKYSTHELESIYNGSY